MLIGVTGLNNMRTFFGARAALIIMRCPSDIPSNRYFFGVVCVPFVPDFMCVCFLLQRNRENWLERAHWRTTTQSEARLTSSPRKTMWWPEHGEKNCAPLSPRRQCLTVAVGRLALVSLSHRDQLGIEVQDKVLVVWVWKYLMISSWVDVGIQADRW